MRPAAEICFTPGRAWCILDLEQETEGELPLANNKKKNDPKGPANDGLWWLITIGCFCTGALWWVGLILMFMNMSGKLPPLSRKNRDATDKRIEDSWGEPVKAQAPSALTPKRTKRRRFALISTIAGACVGLGGLIALASTFWDILRDIFWGMWSVEWIPFYLEDGFTGLALLAVGAAAAGVGAHILRRDKLYRRYYAMAAGRDVLSVHAMADALGVPYQKAVKHLQSMIDDSWFGSAAYIDVSRGRLMLDGSGLEYEAPAPEPEQPEPSAEQTISEEEKILRQIRADNDLIDHPEISRKIDRIEELTRKIFAFIREKPEKAGELRSFLNYYLPQTLKILETYARLEAQGVEGENIRVAKARIEGMMDTLVESYERQLDKLFEGDVLDITTDIEVMEAMLARDGLTADELTGR